VSRDCAILFTHFWSPALVKHVDRLRREASGTLDVYVALHAEPGTPLPDGMAPDIIVSIDDMRARAPARVAALERRSGTKALLRYVDLVWLSGFLNERLAAYDRFWLIEYDVDIKGNWGRFFATAATYEGDLLTTRLRHLSEEPRWSNRKGTIIPPAVTDPLIGLFCLTRLSRPLVEAYAVAMSSPGWDGHFEIVLPSFALSAGFSIAELSGKGPWTPPERTNLHYAGDWTDRGSLRTTYSWAPPQSYRYLRERGPNPGPRDIVYHPIKLDVPPRQRVRFLRENVALSLRSMLRPAYRALSVWVASFRQQPDASPLQPLQQDDAVAERQPVVEQQLRRPPHRHPTGNDEGVREDIAETAAPQNRGGGRR
jgi:hypothetical protein